MLLRVVEAVDEWLHGNSFRWGQDAGSSWSWLCDWRDRMYGVTSEELLGEAAGNQDARRSGDDELTDVQVRDALMWAERAGYDEGIGRPVSKGVLVDAARSVSESVWRSRGRG